MATRRVTTGSKKKTAPMVLTAQARVIDREAIQLRAYERFLARGAVHGHDLEDWLTAEAELSKT
jgi:hypothetical protein